MQGLNSVTVGGNLTRDPELRYTQAGTAVLKMSLAVNESRKDASGEWEDYPNYIDCVMFGKRAEGVCDYLSKGAYAAVTGRFHQSRWEKDGQNRSKIEVVVDNIHFEGKPVGAAKQDGEPSYYDENIPF